MDDKVQNVAIGCDERKREMMFAAMMHEKIAEKRGRQVAPRYHETERKIPRMQYVGGVVLTVMVYQ